MPFNGETAMLNHPNPLRQHPYTPPLQVVSAQPPSLTQLPETEPEPELEAALQDYLLWTSFLEKEDKRPQLAQTLEEKTEDSLDQWLRMMSEKSAAKEDGEKGELVIVKKKSAINRYGSKTKKWICGRLYNL